MALDFLLGDYSPIVTHDRYSAPPSRLQGNACRVRLHCPGKGRTIVGMLSEDFVISGKSKWNSLFGGALGGDIGPKVLDIVDNVAQAIWGYTIRQPYFGRKYWAGTDPLNFNLSVQFASFSDAYKDVYLPAIDLLSLVFPRLEEESKSSAFGDLLNAYIVPGPGVFYNPKRESNLKHEGDEVEISLGKFLFFRGCYINKIDLDVANSFSTDGYPHCIKARIDFDTMDVAYVNPDGTFMDDGFRDASIDMGGIIGNLQKATQKLGEDLSKAAKEGKVKLSDVGKDVAPKLLKLNPAQ